MFFSVFPFFGTWHTTEVQQETGESEQNWYHVVKSVHIFMIQWVWLRLSLLVCVSSLHRVHQAVRWKSRAALRKNLPNVFFSRGDTALENTTVSTGEKYKQQVFCLNLVDSIVKYIQVKLKLLVLYLYAFSPFSPEWHKTIYGFCIWYEKLLVFPQWTYLLPTPPSKCWNLFCSLFVGCSAGCNL